MQLKNSVVGVLLAGLIAVLAGCSEPLNLSGRNSAGALPNLIIKTGTSFGFCVGYCFRELEIDQTGQRFTVKSLRGGLHDRLYEDETGAQLWQELIDLIDLEAIAATDTVLGCPDCADGGAEWIELSSTAFSRKITFEFGDSVAALQPLLDKLRALREVMNKRHEGELAFPKIVLTDSAAATLHRDSFDLLGVAASGDTLKIDVSYSGGCRDHDFVLFMSPAAFMESFPVQADLFLQHEDHDDACDAILRKNLVFNLRPLLDELRTLYGESAEVILNLFAHPDAAGPKKLSLTHRN